MSTADYNSENLLNTAKEAYLNADYAQAVELYSGLKQVDNPYLFVNLGNAQFENKSFGKAIHSYYQAKKLIPRNRELNHNLSLVLDELRLSEPALMSYSYMTWTEAFVLVLVFNIVFLLRKKITQSKIAQFGFVFLFTITALNFSYVTYEQKIQKQAVVISSSAEGYSGNDRAYSSLFELSDGQIVRIVQIDNDWSKIKIGDELGWVPNSDLSFI